MAFALYYIGGIMLIYKARTDQFIEDVKYNKITDLMSENFKLNCGWCPYQSEINSWQNSLVRVRDLIEISGLKDNMIALEYEVPYSRSRIDCLLFGKGEDGCENVVLIELKQWTAVKVLETEGNYVETVTGRKERVVAHPSQQVKGYHGYLKNFVAEFDNPPPMVLFSCAYCHNYSKKTDLGLFDDIYKDIINDFPVYTKEDVKILANKIKCLLSKGEGFEIFNRFMRSPLRPSQKLLENVSKVVKNEVVFSLLNEQLVAKNTIWSKIRNFEKIKAKSVIIVNGGPGTGKSVIAINLLAEAARKNKKVFYGCKSKPFIEGLKKLVGKDGAMLFSNLLRFLPSKMEENEIDLLLIDEAHRIEKTSNHQYTKTDDKTDMPQIEQLIRCAKTAVFFIDDKQNVRSQEIGNSSVIKESAKRLGCSIDEIELLSQYRCMGSNDYLLWIESVLGYFDEKRMLNENEVFDFKIFDNPQTLYNELRKKENEKTNSARIVAGFCWPWSKTLTENGDLVKDVQIGEFAMPWETHGDLTRVPKGYVKWYEWAYKPEGFKQVGCIYTAQGFEFDYVGVIIGQDIYYDEKTDSLKADMTKTKDPTLKKSKENFEKHVKNIYRTLLSRGMKGCYVYFVDEKTRKYFEKRMENPERFIFKESVLDNEDFIPFKILPKDEAVPYKNCVPLYDLEIAAGDFSDVQHVDNVKWVELPEHFRHSKDLFVAKVVGESMNRRIKNGSYCLFKANPVGTRKGKVVLAKLLDSTDAETGGHYTVKIYESEKKYSADGAWEHTVITLKPDSDNPDFKPMIFKENVEEKVSIIAEFVAELE